MAIVVVVENASDQIIVEMVLGSAVKAPPFEVMYGGVRSSAISAARSYLAYENNQVALLLDTDTVNPRRISEQRQTLGDLVYGPAWALEVVLAVPEIEICLFQDPRPLKAVFGESLTSEALVEARFVPKVVLTRLFANAGWNDDYETAIRKFLSTVTPLEALAEYSPLKEVKRFIEAAPQAERTAREVRQPEHARL